MTFLFWWIVLWMVYDTVFQVAKMNGYEPERWADYSTRARVVAFFVWAFNTVIVFLFLYRGRP